MAALIGMPRAAWRRQPPDPVQVKLGTPLTQGLLTVFVGNKLQPIYGRYKFGASVGAPKIVSNVLGNSVRTATSEQIVFDGSVFQYLDSGTISLLAIFHSFNSTIVYEAGSSKNNIAISVPANDSSVLTYNIGNNTNRSSINSTWRLEKPYFLTVTWNASGSALYIDGKLDSKDTTNTAVPTIASYQTVLNGYYIPSRGGYGNNSYAYFVVRNYVLGGQEILDEATNPWQLFKPRIARFISIPSSGPVTFQPAWARLRSLIIGSGV